MKLFYSKIFLQQFKVFVSNLRLMVPAGRIFYGRKPFTLDGMTDYGMRPALDFMGFFDSLIYLFYVVTINTTRVKAKTPPFIRQRFKIKHFKSTSVTLHLVVID